MDASALALFRQLAWKGNAQTLKDQTVGPWKISVESEDELLKVMLTHTENKKFFVRTFSPKDGLVTPTKKDKSADDESKTDAATGSSTEEPEEGKEKKYKHFTVKRKPIRHAFTNEIIDYEQIVYFTDNTIFAYIKHYLQSESTYKSPPRVKLDELFQCQDQLRSYNMPGITELLGFLDTQFGALKAKLDNMIKRDKVISYRTLWYLFTKGKKICGSTDTGSLVGGEVLSRNYSSGIFPSFDIQGTVIKANGKAFYTTTHKFRILPFVGTKALADLPVKILDENSPDDKGIFASLEKRGSLFAKLAVGVHYLNYQGYVAQREGWWGHQLYKAHGRVILDGISFNRINPNSRSSLYSNDGQDIYNEQSNSFEVITEDKFFMTWPTILGFSFTAKKWGELLVETLSEITFDDTAFEHLVLPSDKKTLIKALVENITDKTFSDVISGKGGGCIFLLHGAPGTGKTLTAESIAELLHRPLYSVSVGELGTDTTELEKKLVEILEVSSSWNAVILLDEADIFLEKRTENDIERNAMVGIFLRLLEYHQGVLFLTTNRVKCFDKAFHSRISVALKYEDLHESARTQIWENLLDAAGITGLNCAELGKHPINGRQIRTLTRLAISLAKSEGVKVDKSHLERTIMIANQFQAEVALSSTT